jgi:phage terminase large subunit
MIDDNDIMALFQTSPVEWVEEAFGEDLWARQCEILNSIRDNRRTAVRSCFDIGKSFIAARVALWFLYSFPHSKVITTAPTFRQVEGILWREIRVAKQKARINLKGDLTTTRLNIAPDWFAFGFSTDEPTGFQGFHAVHILLIVDEAAGIDEGIFKASEGVVSSESARTLLIGNPTNLAGTFYSSFKMPNYHHIHIGAFDTPNFTTFGITVDDIRQNTWEPKIIGPLPRPYLITPEWVYDKYLRWGDESPMWQAMVMGDFPQQGDDTLIPLSKIEAATRKVIINLEADPWVVGADIARFGIDKTVFCLRHGNAAIELQKYGMLDTMSTSARLHDYLFINSLASANIDAIGVGAGVVDRMKQTDGSKTINGINVAIPSHEPEMFANLRAEMYWHLRTLFIEGNISIPADEDLMSQLANTKYKFVNGKVQIEAKDDMKKRGLPSPDCADALALAFCQANQRPAVLDFMQQAYGIPTVQQV